jgi:hypothetical protein
MPRGRRESTGWSFSPLRLDTFSAFAVKRCKRSLADPRTLRCRLSSLPAPERVEQFVNACVDDPALARRLYSQEPTLLGSSWMGSPLLHWLVIEDFQQGVSLMLELGSPVDEPDHDGRTALGFACYLGRLGCARILVAAGANVNAPDGAAMNVLELAVGSGHVGIVDLLVRAGAKADYRGPADETVFRAMFALDATKKAAMIDVLRSVGVTPEGLFESLQLRQTYETPAEAYFWS